MGFGAGSFLKVVVKNFDVLAGYASIRAIETESPIDDQQWLTYWVLYSIITLFELTFAKLIEWVVDREMRSTSSNLKHTF